MSKAEVLFKIDANLKQQATTWPAALADFKDELLGVSRHTLEASMRSRWNATGLVVLNYFVTNAIYQYVLGVSSKIGVCKIGNGVYAAQAELEFGDGQGDMLLAHLVKNSGACSAAMVSARSNRYSNLPTFNSRSCFDVSAIMLLAILNMAEYDDGDIFANHDKFGDILNSCKAAYDATGRLPKDAVYRLNDGVYNALKDEKSGYRININGGNIDMLARDRVEENGCSGKVICGRPDMLLKKAQSASGGSYEGFTVQTAKALFTPYTQSLSWTPDEEALIPQYDDDFPVPPETMMFADRFIRSRNKRLPMNNFLWRGITAYGKSTGVEIMACILHTPYVAVTCSSTMEKNDFLSQFVPNSALAAPTAELPSFEEIAADPETAYESITGEYKEGVSCDEALEAYGKAAAAKAGGSHFKLVESDYVKALTRGWLVEIQEISRIKDPGVLVGLNAFDKPNSVIPLVDGRHERRHPNAIVFYTDNVGYVSCRPVDASVVRRVAFVVDSYEMPKERVIDRVKYNTEYENDDILGKMYDLWSATSTYCKEQEITEGSVSVTELERWVSVVAMDGLSAIRSAFRQCVVAKATSDYDTQNEIFNAMEPKLAVIA